MARHHRREAGVVNDVLLRFIGGISAVLSYGLFAAAYKAFLNDTPPFGTEVIGALSLISTSVAVANSWSYQSVRKEEVRAGVSAESGTSAPWAPKFTP
jgi:hypothetical protein